MSKIEEQIRALQKKKQKIDYLSYISDTLKNDKHCIDFNDVKDEVLALLDPILLKLMSAIENDLPTDLEDLDLTADERKALKMVAASAASRIAGGSPPPIAPAGKSPFSDGQTPPKQPKKPVADPQDKMQFAMAHRHLGGKKVNVLNDKNMSITGEVVGLDAPNVIVKTDQGPTIEVPIERIQQI